MVWCSTGVVLEWSFSGCGGVFGVTGGVVVFLFWCGGVCVVVLLFWCGGVFVVAFLRLCFCGGGGVFVVVFLCFCGGVFCMFFFVKGRLSSHYREVM